MVKHTIKNTFKLILRNRTMIFWALAFPIVLAFFYKLAFGNLYEGEKFENIPIGVNEELFQDESMNFFLDRLEEEDFFLIEKAKSEKVLEENEELVAYVKNEDEIITRDSGIYETITETVFNSYLRKKELVMRALKKNPNQDIDGLVENKSFIKDITKDNMDFVNVMFYSIIAMQLLYGYTWGIKIVEIYQANLSTIGMRTSVAPTDKKLQLFSSILVGWVFNFLVSLISIFVFERFLGIDFGNRMKELILLLLVGSLTGVTMGTFIGSVGKKDSEDKMAIGLAATLILSFLAGMMVLDVKLLIEDKFPIINRINPAALVTDGIYALYYYEGFERFYQNLLGLGLITLVFILLTYTFTRRKDYASL